ncbi:MAG: bifunctional glycosyltransferase/CDP-glycerol:glycerophosphate glycerophosphotransferase [Clostridium sp.]
MIKKKVMRDREDMMKVSVIIPVYNVEEYIEETIESLLNQTMKDFEVILVDDESTDRSVARIQKKIEGNEKKFRIITQKNGGPGKARNKGLDVAKGEYIIFMDSDDVLPINSIEIRYNLACEHKADMIIGATYGYDGEKTWPIVGHFFDEGIKTIKNSNELVQSMGPCNKLFRKKLIGDTRFPEDIKYGEDQVFIMSAYIKSKKIYKTNENIYYYRQRGSLHNPSMTDLEKRNPQYVIGEARKAWEKIVNIIDETSSSNELARELKKVYLERLIKINIWPPFKNAIISKEKNLQKEALDELELLLLDITKEVFNDVEKLRWICIQGIINRYLFLSKDVKGDYLNFISKSINKISKVNILELKNKDEELWRCIEKLDIKPKKRFILKYLIKRRLKRNAQQIFKMTRRKEKMIFNLSKIIPIKKDLVILASNKGDILTGNLLAIKNELINQKSEVVIKEYLDEKNRGGLDRIKMYFNFARAKYIFLDDYYRQLYGLKFKNKTEIIQVWHACGAFKKFGFSAIGKKDGNSEEFEKKAHGHYTKVVTSSQKVAKEYAEAFNVDLNKIISVGVPRTDILLDKEYQKGVRDRFDEEFYKFKDKKIILYAPTFRGGPKERKNFKLELNPIELLKNIGEDYILILKFHPSVQNGLKNIIVPKELNDRIINFESKTDINDLIIVSDIIITDYSSVVFEGTLLDKKIIMFAYDKEEYLRERDFYYEYDSFVPGKIAKTNEDIVEIINKDDFDMNRIKEFKGKFFDHYDGQASKRLVENVFN